MPLIYRFARHWQVSCELDRVALAVHLAVHRLGSVNAAAAEAGVNRLTLMRWRDGLAIPRRKALPGLARAANVPLAWLLPPVS